MASASSISLVEPLLSPTERLTAQTQSDVRRVSTGSDHPAAASASRLTPTSHASTFRCPAESSFTGVNYKFLQSTVAACEAQGTTNPTIQDFKRLRFAVGKELNEGTNGQRQLVSPATTGVDLEELLQDHVAGKRFQTSSDVDIFGQPVVCLSRPSRQVSLKEVLSAVECWVEDCHVDSAAQTAALEGMFLWIEGLLGDITTEYKNEEVASEDGSLLRHIQEVGTMLVLLDPWLTPSEPRALCLWEVHCSTMSGATLQIAMSRYVRERLQSALITDYEDCFRALMDLDLIRWARTDPNAELASLVIQMVESTIGLPQMNEMLHLRLMKFVQETGARALDRLRTDANSQESRCRLQDSLARFLREKGQTQRAEQMFLDLRDTCSQHFGPTAPLTLQCLNQLAVTYQKMGNVRQACTIHQDLLSKRLEVAGEHHADTLQTMSNLAFLLAQSQDPNDMARGRELYKLAVDGRRSIAPANPSTFYTISNYAKFLSEHGDQDDDWKQAAALHEEAAQELQKLVGAGHPLTLMAMQGQCEHRVTAAKALLRDACADLDTVVRGRREKLGKEHKDTKVSAALLRVARYVQGAFDATNMVGGMLAADASEGWKTTLELATPAINTASTFRTCRAQVRVLTTDKIRSDLGAFVSARGALTTSEVPFNLFARYAAGVEKQIPEMLEAQELLGTFQDSFMIVFPKKEDAGQWASTDPAWVAQATLSKNHAYLTIKDLSWQWFNVAVFGMFDNLKEAIELLKQMRNAALHYCARDKRWSSNIGLFVNVLTDINSFHIHIVDLDWTGPAFAALNERNLPLDVAIKVLEEEHWSSTSHHRREPFEALAAEDESMEALAITEAEMLKSLEEWPDVCCGIQPPGLRRWSSPVALHEEVIVIAVALSAYALLPMLSYGQIRSDALLELAISVSMAVSAFFMGSASPRLCPTSIFFLMAWFCVNLFTNPYRAAKLRGQSQGHGAEAWCIDRLSGSLEDGLEDCITRVFRAEVQLLCDLIGVLFVCTVWLPVSLITASATAVTIMSLFIVVSLLTQAPMDSLVLYAFVSLLMLAFLEVCRGREATVGVFERQRSLAKAKLGEKTSEVEAAFYEGGSSTLGLVFHNLAMVCKLLVIAEPVSALGNHFQAAARALRSCRSLLVNRQSIEIANMLRGLSDSDKRAAGEILEMLEGEGDNYDRELSLARSRTSLRDESMKPMIREESLVPGRVERKDPYLAETFSVDVAAPTNLGETMNIDFLELAEASGSKAMLVGGVAAFNKFFTDKQVCKATVFCDFLEAIQKLYMDNPYHNEAHGIDVANSCLFLTTRTTTDIPADMLFAGFIAALGHDVGHPGLNNNFFNSQKDHPLCMVYSSSILENFHVAMLNSILLDRNQDVSQSFSKDDKTRFRSLIAELILATDMARHFDLIKNYQSKRLDEKCEFDSPAWQRMHLGMIMKSADIGHSFKAWKLHYAWSCCVQAEFFAQGDLERSNLWHLSPVCDRHTVQFAKGQIGFITCVAKPLLKELIERTQQQQKQLDNVPHTIESLSQFEANAEKWATQEDPLFPPASNAQQQELLWATYAASRRLQDALLRAHSTVREGLQPAA